MGDWGGVRVRTGQLQHLPLAEILGLAMARRAADILDRHRAALMGGPGAAARQARGSGEVDAVGEPRRPTTPSSRSRTRSSPPCSMRPTSAWGSPTPGRPMSAGATRR